MMSHSQPGFLTQLPTELHLMIASYLKADDLADLRTTCKQIAENVNDAFFSGANFHIIINEEQLPVFEELVDSPIASKIRNIKLANQNLLRTHVITSKRWRGLLGQEDVDDTRVLDRHGRLEEVETLKKRFIPSEEVISRFVRLIVSTLTNVTSVGTYTAWFQAAYSYVGSDNRKTLHSILDIYATEREDWRYGRSVARWHHFHQYPPLFVWHASNAIALCARQNYHFGLGDILQKVTRVQFTFKETEVINHPAWDFISVGHFIRTRTKLQELVLKFGTSFQRDRLALGHKLVENLSGDQNAPLMSNLTRLELKGLHAVDSQLASIIRILDANKATLKHLTLTNALNLGYAVQYNVAVQFAQTLLSIEDLQTINLRVFHPDPIEAEDPAVVQYFLRRLGRDVEVSPPLFFSQHTWMNRRDLVARFSSTGVCWSGGSVVM